MKICPVGIELFHMAGWTDKQADITKLIAAFRKFANAPKTVSLSSRTFVNVRCSE
jgi:hypothetical protein